MRRRGWLTDERFLDLLGATNLIPGPNSTEMAIHIGWERRRFAGLVVAGLSFILPAGLITAALGWIYVRYGAVPAAGSVLYGVKPVMVAIVLQAIFKLAPKAARTLRLRAIGVLALALVAAGVHELAVLFGGGALSIAITLWHDRAKTPSDPGKSAPSKTPRTPANPRRRRHLRTPTNPRRRDPLRIPANPRCSSSPLDPRQMRAPGQASPPPRGRPPPWALSRCRPSSGSS